MRRDLPELQHEKAEKHREWIWCRRKNGFSDNPLWRVVAAQLDMPLYQVVAFVNRLEELANAGEPRGSVAEFRAGEFGAALGMSAADAERIYVALESSDVRWIDGEHLATFFARNPDREDPTTAKRSQRYRDRRECAKHLRRLAREKRIAEATRRNIEDGVKYLQDDALAALLKRLRYGDVDGLQIGTPTQDLSTAPANFSSRSVTRDDRDVTLRADHITSRADVDKSAENESDGASVATAGPSEEGSGESAPDLSTIVADVTSVTREVVTDETALALRWLETEGARIVTDRMMVEPPRAALLMARWRRDLEDPLVLVDAILGADRVELSAGRFHVLVTDQLSRHLRAREQGLPLPLRPVPIGATTIIKRSESQSASAGGEGLEHALHKKVG